VQKKKSGRTPKKTIGEKKFKNSQSSHSLSTGQRTPTRRKAIYEKQRCFPLDAKTVKEAAGMRGKQRRDYFKLGEYSREKVQLKQELRGPKHRL